MRVGWRLGVVLALFGATAALLYTAAPVTSAVNPASLFALPPMVGAWSSVEGVPEEILPIDPNEKVSVRRTYSSAGKIAWVSVSLFVGQDDEARHSSINRIYPQRSVSLIDVVPFTARLGAPPASPVGLPAVLVHRESQRLLVAYWHQIGHRVYGSEYGFRLALMRNRVFTRRADALLIRIAAPVAANDEISAGLETVGALATPLSVALTDELTR